MLYELAIIPDVFDKRTVESNPMLLVVLPEFLRGVLDCAIVANLDDGAWEQDVIQRVDDLPIKLRPKVKDLLRRLKERRLIVKHRRIGSARPTTADNWLSEAAAVDQVHALDGIVSSDDLFISTPIYPKLIAVSEVLDHKLWVQRSSSAQIDQCDAGLRVVLASVLRHTRTVQLVDPFMNPHDDRFVRTVRLCIEYLGTRGTGQLPGSIVIHALDPLDTSKGSRISESIDERGGRWEQQLRKSIQKSNVRTVTLAFWRRRPSGEDFHDRFVLTDQLGIAAPGGLDCFPKPGTRTSTWFRLDHAITRSTKSKFDVRKPSTYALAGTFTILGSIP